MCEYVFNFMKKINKNTDEYLSNIKIYQNLNKLLKQESIYHKLLKYSCENDKL